MNCCGFSFLKIKTLSKDNLFPTQILSAFFIICSALRPFIDWKSIWCLAAGLVHTPQEDLLVVFNGCQPLAKRWIAPWIQDLLPNLVIYSLPAVSLRFFSLACSLKLSVSNRLKLSQSSLDLSSFAGVRAS